MFGTGIGSLKVSAEVEGSSDDIINTDANQLILIQGSQGDGWQSIQHKVQDFRFPATKVCVL